MIYDFDIPVQEIFERNFNEKGLPEWREWLDLSSKEEYLDKVSKLSGIDTTEPLKRVVTDPKNLSVSRDYSCHEADTCFLLHTSGTSGGGIEDLKWYHLSKETILRLWAPGMKAIFESSGLTQKGSSIIFVPNRLSGDGHNDHSGFNSVRLYSSEFSQRLTLSVIKPKSYLMEFYQNSRSIPTLTRILDLDDIQVLSAPASTILNWADPHRLKKGLERSYQEMKKEGGEFSLASLIERSGSAGAVKEVQKRLYDVLKEATLIFSTSSLSGEDWFLIDRFFGWDQESRRFTNLYVGSEIGPFAASIDPLDKMNMCVFPLTYPLLEIAGERKPIVEVEGDLGRLFVSYLNNGKPIYNIETGDVIEVLEHKGMPRISSSILRAPFKLKTHVAMKDNSVVYTGDFFEFTEFTITNARILKNCVLEKGAQSKDELPMVLLSKEDHYELLHPDIDRSRAASTPCEGVRGFEKAVASGLLKMKKGERPVKPLKQRKEVLKLNRKGAIPKGALKKWPFYYLKGSSSPSR